MVSEVPAAVRAYLSSHSTMTLATATAGRPWAAPVFYVCDDDLRLYFVSDPGTRHATQATENPNVAAAIYEHDQPWQSIRGVQIEGCLRVVPPADRPRVEALYWRRFPAIGRLLAVPANDDERLLRRRIAEARFYVLSPGIVRFVDNTLGFGHREDYVVDEAALHT